jgi:hypothetical protein
LRVDLLSEVPKLSTKNTLALGTLVAAVPAALLGFFLVMSFLQHLDPLQKQGTMYVALYGTTLAACAAVVFLPVAVLIFGPRTAKAGAAPKSGTIPKAPPTSVDQPVVDDLSESTGDEAAPALKTSRKAMSTGELEVIEPTPSMDEIMAYDEGPASRSKGMSTGELEVVEATPSMDDLVAYDDEVMPKSGEVPAVDMDEDFAVDDEPVKPPKKKGK